MNINSLLSDLFQKHHEELSSRLPQSTCRQTLIDNTRTLPTSFSTLQGKPLRGTVSGNTFAFSLNKRSAQLICEGSIIPKDQGSIIQYTTRYGSNPLLLGILPLAFVYNILAHGINQHFNLSLPTLVTRDVWFFSAMTVLFSIMFIYSIVTQIQNRLQEEIEIRNWLQIRLEARQANQETTFL
jgi:hypothetical protein